MLTLYVKTGCPYCAKVIDKVKELGLKIENKNILDEGVVDELIKLGGKRQVPFLVDSERNIQMYGSDDISQYLDMHYGAQGVQEGVGEAVSSNQNICTSEC